MDESPEPTHFLWQVQTPTFTAAVVVTGGAGPGRIVDAAPLLRQWIGKSYDDLFRFCSRTHFRLVYVGPHPLNGRRSPRTTPERTLP